MKFFERGIVGNILIILLIALVIFMASCSPQKKLNRLIDNNPNLVQNDTIEIHDTIITPSVRLDTLLQTDSITDTIYIERDNLKIKTIFKDNTIYIEGECESDTITLYKEIQVERLVYVEDTMWTDVKNFLIRKWRFMLTLFIFLIVGAVVKRIMR